MVKWCVFLIYLLTESYSTFGSAPKYYVTIVLLKYNICIFNRFEKDIHINTINVCIHGVRPSKIQQKTTLSFNLKTNPTFFSSSVLRDESYLTRNNTCVREEKC